MHLNKYETGRAKNISYTTERSGFPKLNLSLFPNKLKEEYETTKHME